MKLTEERVVELFDGCLWDTSGDHIAQRCIEHSAAFSKSLLEKNREAIRELLMELPTAFHSTNLPEGGGGWTFLNTCFDKDYNQWTDQHLVQEMLIMLGLATGQVVWSLPRELWVALPHGMPYLEIR